MPPLGGDADHIVLDPAELIQPSLPGKLQHIPDVLRIDRLAPGRQLHQPFDGLLRVGRILLISGDMQLRFPIGNAHLQLLFQKVQVFVERAENADQVFQAVNADDTLCHELTLFGSFWYF